MKFLVATTALIVSAAVAKADDVTSANYLCALLDSTGMTSAECELSPWNSAVTTSIDMESGEARKLCAKLSGYMREKGYTFERDWQLQIRSPYSGESSIAFCPLPRS